MTAKGARRKDYQAEYYQANREDIMSRRAIKRRKYRTAVEAHAAAKKQRRKWWEDHQHERRATPKTLAKPQVLTVGLLHQDLTTPGYSRCVPPPVAGSVAMQAVEAIFGGGR